MQRFFGIAFVSVSAMISFAGCSGGGSSPSGGGGGSSGPTTPPVITESYTFPSGTASASAGTAWNIVGLKTTLSGQYGGSNSYDTLRVDVTFSQDISSALPAPSASLTSGTQLGVQIYLDTDGNPMTGSQPSCNLSLSQTPFEYFSLASSRLTDGNYSIAFPGGTPVYQGGSNPAAEAITSVSGNTFTQSFYLATLGVFDGTAVPRMGVAAAAFNGTSGSDVDCVPLGNVAEVFTS